ncbi:MAG: hypothetical protein FWB81_00710 [Cystobacterineae bacterium]|nr:hypothetical protein [Cystobacterineae bacterium]
MVAGHFLGDKGGDERELKMDRRKRYGLVFLLCMVGGVEGFAQARASGGGVPEEAERGLGGYSHTVASRFSVAVDGGANFVVKKSPAKGAPFYIGGTGSYWITEWALMGIHLNYAFNTERFMALIGPTFRTDTWPLSFHISCKAGFARDGQEKKSRLAVAPQFGMDILLVEHLIIGLLGAWDLPTGKGRMPSQVRLGLNLGWRF